MFKLYTSTLLKRVKGPKIPQNEKSNLKPTKIAPKSKKWSVFSLSLGVFWSFSVVARVFCLFLRIQWYFGHFTSFRGYCGRFRGVLVIFRVLGYFGRSWCILIIFGVLRGSFQRFWCIYKRLFDILVILTGKTYIYIYFDKNITLKSLEWPIYSQNHQNYQNTLKPIKCPKKTPRNPLIDQNSLKISKMSKINQNPLK